MIALKPSSRHISTRKGSGSIQRQLSFADSRGAGQSFPTEDWPQSPEPPPTHSVWHWTDWPQSPEPRPTHNVWQWTDWPQSPEPPPTHNVWHWTDWPQSPEPPPTHNVWHWTDWPQSPEPPPTHNVWHWDRPASVPATWDSRQHRPRAPDMPNIHSCLRQHLAISHKLGEETLRLTGGSLGNGCIHPRDWIGHLNRDERRRREIDIAKVSRGM